MLSCNIWENGGYEVADFLDFFNVYVMGSIQMLTGFHFFTRFFKKEVNPIYYILFAMFGIAIIMFVPTGSIIEFFAYILLLVAGGIFICKANSVAAILYAVVTVEIMQICYGVFNSILCILYPLMYSLNPEIVGTAFMALESVALLLSAFCYRMVYRHFLYHETDKNQYALMILMPTLMIFLTGQYINSTIYGNTITTGKSGVIINANHYQMLLIQLFGIASLFCIMFAYKKMLENFRLSTELSLLEQEEHSLYQYVEEAKERYEKTRSFRHDVKNHITIVKELLRNNKLEQALNYVGDMENMIADMSFSYNTNNPVVDILLANKLGVAGSNGINVHCSLVLPYPCSVNDIDFCIILSNALDNAIRACKKVDESTEKYIHVTGSIQGDFILLKVENSFQGKEVLRKGIGLTNIKAVAEKYHGAMSVKTQDAVFVLSVLLIIP